MAAGNSKKDNLIITDVTSNNGKKFWLHIRILYSVCLVVILSLAVTVWLGYRELQRVRRDLKHDIRLESRRYVEFNPEFKYSNSNSPTQFSGSNQETQQNGDNSFGQRLDIKTLETEEDNIGDSAEQEQFLRVKRNARRHGHGNAREESSTAHERRNPSYIKEPEGSGVELPEDWVWLTSYSRIPTFALTEFCSATQHYCPPGPPGPQGMPGIQGLKGNKGGVGPIGLKGDQGVHGITGLNGTDGQKGETGETGVPGINGEKGHQGTKGDKGDLGDRGIPGLPGMKGVKGDIGETGFNGTDGIMGLSIDPERVNGNRFSKQNGYYKQPTEVEVRLARCERPCPTGPAGEPGIPGIQGPAGPQGEPGYNGTDGLPGARGKRGKKGYSGSPGQQGFQGQEGPRGEKGQKGGVSAGVPNCTCEKGERGEKGKKGDVGPRGQIGFLGYTGEKGSPGPPGPPGPYSYGETGSPGAPGPRGQKGDKGSPGLRYAAGSNLVLETTRRPVVTSTTTTTAPTTIRRSTTPEPVLPPRIKECKIRMVGKPLFKRYTGTWWGTWMTDANPRKPEDATKYWYSRHFTGKILAEYNNFENFRSDHADKRYELGELYFGTGHVIYHGALFYHRAGYSEILKFDLETEKIEGRALIPDANYQGKENYVYSTEYNFFDLAVDENGLWVIYGSTYNKKHLFVAKLDHKTMKIQKIITVEVDHQSYGNGFIACGVLYLVKDTNKKTTFVDFEYDLYKEQHTTIRLKFSNPFQMNNMVAYDPKQKQIYCWDKGNQLSYPLLTS